jgi:hypothetical protein
MKPERLIAWLRGLNRGYKFGILLAAAWAPFALPNHPLITWAFMALMTFLFLLATARGKVIATTEAPVGHEKADVDS